MSASISSLRGRLFLTFVLVTVIAAAVPLLFMRGSLYQDKIQLAGKEALSQALFIRGLLEPMPEEKELQKLFGAAKELSFRITLMDSSSRVLRDSHIGSLDLPDLDNHGDRPEIEDARATGTGISLRHSNSLGLDAVYAAVPLQGGGTLRIAVPLAEIRHRFEDEAAPLTLVVVLVVVFCLALSVFITSRVRRGLEDMTEVVASIARDKGGRHILEAPYAEFIPLTKSVNHMADAIEEYLQTTTDQQQQLETILDSMQEALLVLGPAGNIRRYNKAAAEMFPAVSSAMGKAVIDVLPIPALQNRVDTLLAGPALKENGESIHFELPRGRHLVAHASSPAMRNDTLGAVIVIYDATELMRLERVRKDFVSNVSHELRTPLTAIAGYAETLLDSPDLQSEYRGFAAIIHKHANMLARIINDLLSLARIEDEVEPIVIERVEPATAIDEAVSVCRDQAAARGVKIRTELENAAVQANSRLLSQVFRNLIENALRYSPEQGEVVISGQKQGGAVLFTVSDNGPGIAPGELPRIFERFYQVEKERNSGTSGIGLAICRHIIERHGGRIWAESPYQGASTAMLFTLPAAE